MGVLALTAILLQSVDLLGDHAYANVAVMVLGTAAVITLLVWFFFRSGYRWQVRAMAANVLLVLVMALLVLFRVDHTSGELIPVFAWRFSIRPDQKMTMPPAGDAAAKTSPSDWHTTPHDFPQFLGPERSASVNVKLARDWTEHPPKQLWRHEIGAGWSAFSVVADHAVTMEQRGDSELVTCYHVPTGKLEWAHATDTRYDTVSGGVGPRSTPTVVDGLVFALGATGHLVCLDAATGTCRWEKDLLKEYDIPPQVDADAVFWGRSNSPLVVDSMAIVPIGGQEGRLVSLAAFETATGKMVWEAGKRQISYSSPSVATVAGVKQILTVNEDTVSGHDPKTGRVLWEHPWPARSNADPNVAQAVAIAPDRVFLSKGYRRGAALVELRPQGDGTFTTAIVWENSSVMRTKFANVALHDGYAYGLSDGILECVSLATGKRAWKNGRYKHGQLLRAEDLLLVLSERGEMVLVEASPEPDRKVLGQFQAIEGQTWNNLALAGSRLLIRNAEEAACYELPLAPPAAPKTP